MKSIINPIIEAQMKHICDIERIKESLEVRLALIGQDYSNKDEFEQNECDILKMKTEIEIEKLNNRLNIKKDEFSDTMKIYIQELEELEIQ